MIRRIDMLPHWVLTNPRPAFYDSESLTAVEQTARVYAKMQELLEDYNKFIDEINTHITDYETNLYTNFEEFKVCITNTMENYIECIDLKIDKQDKVIDEAVKFMKDNLSNSITQIVNDMKDNGELSNAILQAFEDVTTSLNNILPVVGDLKQRVGTLEKTEYVLEHDDATESLRIVKKVGV